MSACIGLIALFSFVLPVGTSQAVGAQGVGAWSSDVAQTGQDPCSSFGTVQELGLATPGTAGLPELELEGAPLEGLPFQLRVRNARLDSFGWLVTGFEVLPQAFPAQGATLHPAPPILQAFLVNAQGDSDPLLVLGVVPPNLCGRTVVAQAIVRDPRGQGGAAFTKAVRVDFGDPPSGASFPGEVLRPGNSPDAVAAEDLNADGVLDLAVTTFGGVAVQLGLAGGGFEPPVEYPLGISADSVAIGDLNGDLVLDLAVAWVDGVGLLFGLGDGTFSNTTTLPLAETPKAVAIEDLNLDGILDLAVGANPPFTDGLVYVIQGIGNGLFASPVPHDVGRRPESIATGLLNGDAFPDIVVAAASANEVSVLFGAGGGAFLPAQGIDVGSSPESVAMADVDGDGVLDLVTANVGSDDLSLLLGVGDGSFLSAASIPVGDVPRGLAVGDLDADGVLDLVSANRNSRNLTVLRGLGGGSFATAQVLYSGESPAHVVIADVDADQISDLVVADDGILTSNNQGDVVIHTGLGDGTFPVPQSVSVGTEPVALVVGDLDGDQIPDVATANRESEDVTVALGAGDGTLVLAGAYPAGKDITALALGDLNDDQVPDLVVANRLSGGLVSVLLGTGGGGFAPAQTYSADVRPTSVAIGDLNQDGVPDLAAGTQNGLTILLGVGDGSFGSETVFPAGVAPQELAIEDLDGDGLPEVIVATIFTLEVLSGPGDGTFAPTASFDLSSGVRALALADLNLDQVPDIVALLVDDELTVLMGTGNGGFVQQALPLAPHLQRTGLAIADLNGDRVPDLALTNSLADDVSVLLGEGDGTFHPERRFLFRYEPGLNSFPRKVVLEDMNGDLIPDFVAAYTYANEVVVGFNLLLE